MKTYTEDEVIEFVETLGYFYKFDYERKTWNMQTHLAPGMLHQTTKQLLDRLIDTPKWWEERKKYLGI
jgi:hypothetical protein